MATVFGAISPLISGKIEAILYCKRIVKSCCKPDIIEVLGKVTIMTQKSNDSRTLIIVAFITGIFGVISACVTGFFALKASQSEQEALATNTALAQQVSSGNSTQSSLVQTVDAPTITPVYTQTLLPTYTPFPTIPPTATLIPPSQTPAIVMILPCEDSFELRAKPEWQPQLGTWRVVDGHFTGVNDRDWQTALVGDVNWNDYVIEATAYSKDFVYPVRIIVRATDEGFLAFEYNSSQAKWIILREGKEQTIAEAKSRQDYNRSYLIKVTVKGDIFTGYLNGLQILQVQDTTFSHGRVGISYSSPYLVWFDDFRVAGNP